MKFENIRVVHIIFWSDDVIHYPAALITHKGLRNLYQMQTQLFSGLSRGNARVKIKNVEPLSSIFHAPCPLLISKISVRYKQTNHQKKLLLGIYRLKEMSQPIEKKKVSIHSNKLKFITMLF